MAFSQTGITDVRVTAIGGDLFVAWSASVPSDSTFQVYVDRRLAWSGVARRCQVPIPSGGVGRNVWVEVGTVGADEPNRDYSTSLVAPGGRSERAQLSWDGGTYLDPTGRDDIQGFLIYQGPTPGAAVDLSAPVGTVASYPGGWINDGFGKGGFGGGGFGRSATHYQWRSGPLSSGVWQFAVLPFDKAGNALGASQPIAVTIAAAPRPPAIGPNGSRLTSVYAGPAGRQLTINWLPSPSDLR
jgi:hypothetical protein